MLGINKLAQKYRIDFETAEDLVRMRDALANNEFSLPSLHKFICTLGIEQEVNVFELLEDRRGARYLQPFRGVDSIVEEEDNGLATEIASHQVESVSGVISESDEVRPMEAYFNMAIDRYNVLKQILLRRNLSSCMVGNLPFSSRFLSQYCLPDHEDQGWICQKERYLKMVRTQNGNEDITENPYMIQIQRVSGFRNGEPVLKKHWIKIPMSSALYSLAAQSSMNLGVPGERIGFAANMMTALMPVAAVFSNSRFMYKGISAHHWNRITYAKKGMGSRERLFKFMLPEYYKSLGAEAIMEWLEHCFSRELLVPYDEGGGKRKTFCPYLRTRAGQAWTFSPRITWGLAPNSSLQTIWVENNSIDAQPTLIEALALDLLFAGYMAFHHYEGNTDVSRLIPANQIEAVCQTIGEFGPYSEKSVVPWNGENIRADKWVMDRLIPDALKGVEKDDLCDVGLAATLFEVLKKALINRCTGSDWVLRRAKELNSASNPTANAILLELSEIQSLNEDSLSNPKGLFDVLKEQGRI